MSGTLEVIELRRFCAAGVSRDQELRLIDEPALKINQSAEGSFCRAGSAKLAGTNDSFKNVEK